MATKRFIQLGERKDGRISKNESFELNGFVDKLLQNIDKDILDSLSSYGKITNLKQSIKAYLNKIITEDVAGKEE